MSLFEVIAGVEGPCLALDGTRIAGPKPWGGGRVVEEFETEERYAPERECEIVEDGDGRSSCSLCGAAYLCMSEAAFCPGCGARVRRNDG